jgi:hypothetical protein
VPSGTNVLRSRFLVPLGVAVIGGVLVELATSKGLLGTLKSLSSSAVLFLGKRLELPMWAVILLCLGILPTVVILVVLLIAALSGKDESSPESYSNDSFFGLKWHWTYPLSFQDLHALCPNCGYEPDMEAFELPDFVGSGCRLKCDACGFATRFDFSESTLRKRVVKLIQRNLREKHSPIASEEGA